MPRRPRRRSQRIARWAGVLLLQLVIFLLALEGLSVLSYPLISDRPYSRSRIKESLAKNTEAQGGGPALDLDADDSVPGFIAEHILHPYTGFSDNPAKDPRVNELGFWGKNPLVKRSPGKVNVVILGGSVALQFYQMSRETLVGALRGVPEFAGKEFDVVCLAVAGYKQPQQLLALTYMISRGAEYDIAINLDGFNEIVLPFSDNLPHGVPLDYPRIWNFYSRKGVSLGNTLRMAEVVSLRRAQESLGQAFSLPLLGASNFGLILWETLDRRYERRAQEAYLELMEAVDREQGDGSWGVTPAPGEQREPYFREATARWRQSSILIHDLARTNGFRYYHFLQPNQYVEGSKVFSDLEKRIADLDAWEGRRFPFHPSVRSYKWAARNGYPYLIEAGRELRASGVDYFDLTMLFAEVQETVYNDFCCHYVESGYERIAVRMAGEIARGD